MPFYENIFIARQDVSTAQVEALTEQFVGIVDAQGGKVTKREYWGLKSLAYRIKKNRKGHYMLLGLDAPAAAMQEMERQLSLHEDVLRFLTVRVEEISEEPSAILSRKSDERDRNFRGPKPAGRFESGRKRGFDEREEFRARDEYRADRDEFSVEEDA
jgi:small subunit ribosomal protein S6